MVETVDLVIGYLNALASSDKKIPVPEEVLGRFLPHYKKVMAGHTIKMLQIEDMEIPEVKDDVPLEFYVEKLRERYKKVVLITIAQKILQENIIDHELLSKVEDLNDETQESHMIVTKKRIMDRHQGKEVPYIPTGLDRLDRIAWLDWCNFILIAAEKKIGKTRFAVQLAVNFLKQAIPVKFFSLEMTAEELIRTFLLNLTSISEDLLMSRTGKMSNIQVKKTSEAFAFIGDGKLDIHEGLMSVHEISRKIGKFKGVVFIDNLGLINSKEEADKDPAIPKEIKKIRDRTGSVIFLLHHMTKAQSEAIEVAYMPQLKFVRGSGRVLDYVNQVWLLHRPGFYRDLTDELKKGLDKEQMEQITKMFLVDVALNRSGDTGTVRISHNIKMSQFESLQIESLQTN